MASFLSRYLSGEHEAVWADLRALGEAVRDRRHFDDARAVAVETMRRTRRNVEILIDRLSGAGYEFGIEGVGYATAPLCPPNEHSAEFAD